METTREYKLVIQDAADKPVRVIRSGFATEALAKAAGMLYQDRDEQEFKIQYVTIITSTVDIFTVPALPPPPLDRIADGIAGDCYGASLDWSDEDFTRLSEVDKELVRGMVYAQTDDCSNCGWTYRTEDLCEDSVHGLICDNCESNLQDDEDEGEEDED